MSIPDIIIAVDGFSSTGKSTFAKLVAEEFGFLYLDSGAMYRGVTLAGLEAGVIGNGHIDEVGVQGIIGPLDLHFRHSEGTTKLFLGDRCIEAEIRGLEVSNNVSPVAAIPFVRHEMVRQQQAMAKKKGVVMDGRDIGTTVLPDAEIKVFVTSSALVRAQRRYAEMLAKGDTSVTLDDIVKNVEMRDHLDSTRKESPLRQAPDAILLDSTPLTIEGQRQWLFDLFNDYLKTH